MPEGRLAPEPGNAATDVARVAVGYRSLRGDGRYTGVTAIPPHPGDPFRLKPRAASEVINVFGNAAGPMQVAELGIIETPICSAILSASPPAPRRSSAAPSPPIQPSAARPESATPKKD